MFLSSIDALLRKIDPISHNRPYSIRATSKQCPLCCIAGEPFAFYASWGLALECLHCKNSQWIVCTECTDQRKKYTERRMVIRHHNSYHRMKVNQHNDTFAAEVQQDNDEYFPADNDDNQEIIPISVEGTRCQDQIENNMIVFDAKTDLEANWLSCGNLTTFGHEQVASQKYFHHKHLSSGFGGGRDYLVKQSILQRDLKRSELTQIEIPEGEDILMLKMAKLVFTLSSTQHQLLVDVLHGCYTLGCEDGYMASIDATNIAFNEHLAKHNYEILSPQKDMISNIIVSETFDDIKLKVKRRHQGSIPIPESTNDFRKYFTEGKHAIMPNLPMPAIHTDIPEHATLSIIECIRDFLSHHCGNERLEAITPLTSQSNGVVHNCCQSQRGRTILANAVRRSEATRTPLLAIRLDFWSDDFEPNNTKQNRQSVWVKTFTIGTRRETGQEIRATYPLAVGGKHDPHDEVERKHWMELMRFMSSDILTPFYVGSKKSFIHLHAELFSVLQDQPERRSANFLRGGGSNYVGRWGVSANSHSLYPVLIACHNCYAEMQTKYENNTFNSDVTECDCCLNWDVMASPKSTISLTAPPKGYPLLDNEKENNNCYADSPSCRLITIRENNQQLLVPFQITYDGLKTSVNLAYHMYQKEAWTRSQCETFLEVEGLNAKYITTFMENATNSLALTIAEPTPGPELLELQQMKLEAPERFQQLEHPALWEREGVPLTTTIDAIMHLLFLGIVKSLLVKTQDWLKRQGLNKQFLDSFPPLLGPLLEMSLDWVSLQAYRGDKFGGWVSENYLGFSRIMNWFYQNIDQLCPNNEDKIPPAELPQKKWLRKHNYFWLQCRGLDTKGNAQELRDKVASYIASTDDTPLEQTLSPNDVKAVVTVCTDMLACIMDSEVTQEHICKVNVLVRIFLQCYDQLDKSIRKSTEKPEVISKPNFCSLLNLPETMATFGPLRNLWEGEFRGEGALRVLKPLICQGLRPKWQVHLLRKMLKHKSLDSVLEKQKKEKIDLLSKDGLRSYSRKFQKYNSRFDFLIHFKAISIGDKVPLSIVILETDRNPCKILAVVGDFNTLLEIEFLATAEQSRKKFGLTYYKFTVPDEAKLSSWDDVVSTSTVAKIGFALLLPLLDTKNETEETRLFALVSSNWKSLSSTLTLSDLI